MPREGAGRPAERKRVGPERPPDFDRLPKRWKDYLRETEHRLHSLEKLVEEAPKSPVILESYASDIPTRYLPADARVSFALPDGKVEVQIGKRRGSDTLQISTPDGRLLVFAECSNEVGVKVGRIV